jgi:hypothetical protein
MDVINSVLIASGAPFPHIVMMDDAPPDDSSVDPDADPVQDAHLQTWPSHDEDPILGR